MYVCVCDNFSGTLTQNKMTVTSAYCPVLDDCVNLHTIRSEEHHTTILHTYIHTDIQYRHTYINVHTDIQFIHSYVHYCTCTHLPTYHHFTTYSTYIHAYIHTLLYMYSSSLPCLYHFSCFCIFMCSMSSMFVGTGYLNDVCMYVCMYVRMHLLRFAYK
jgi:hypothetical protein